MENKLNNSKNKDIIKQIINYDEYYLIKDNIVLNILIGYNEKEIILKYRNYIALFNKNNLSILTKNTFDSIDKGYLFIIDIFEKNKVYVKDIEINKKIKLILNFKGNKEIEINLIYNNVKNFTNENLIKNEINILKKDIKNLKEENNKLKLEIDKLKKFRDNKTPKNFQLLSDITNDSYADDNSDNSFTLFTSINNLIYVIFTNIKRAIISYNINSQKKIAEIKEAHFTFITNFRYYFDKVNKRDIIMSLSCKDNNIKLWNFKNWECFLNLIDINNNGDIYSACFLNANNNNYLTTSNCNWNQNCEPIKIFDFEGNKIKEINNSNDKTFYIEYFFDDNLKNYYFITGNFSYIKSYDYNKNELYLKYNDNDNKCHLSIIIRKFENIFKIIDSCTDGNIRIWNFHTGLLFAKIKISNDYLRGICLLDNDYLLVSCDDQTIKIIDLKRRLVIKSLVGHNDKVLTIKKIFHPQYGDCIISQGYQTDQIKMWINLQNDFKYFI